MMATVTRFVTQAPRRVGQRVRPLAQNRHPLKRFPESFAGPAHPLMNVPPFAILLTPFFRAA
jgi:hypothetical protein